MSSWLPLQAVALRRKGDRTRERIFHAALEEFREAGFEQASIGRIAARAGTSRASFYFHYPSKDAVLLDLQWLMEVRVVERTRSRRGLEAFLTELIDALIAEEGREPLMRDMLSVYFRKPVNLDLADQQFPLVMELGRRFTEARDRELRHGLDPELATHLFLTSLFGALAGWPPPLSSKRDDLLQLAGLFLADPAPRAVAPKSTRPEGSSNTEP